MRIWALVLALLVCPAESWAHQASDSYLTLSVNGARIEGRIDVALRDLDGVIGLDADGDGAITWGELRARHGAITAYVLSRLSIAREAVPCNLRVVEYLVDRYAGDAYTVLRVSAGCGPERSGLDIHYALFFDIDRQHRGLVRVLHDGHAESAVFGPDSATQRIELGASSRWRAVLRFWREGVWHIWVGFDHVLFLLTLLLPAVLTRRGGDWSAACRFGPVVSDTVKIVTAFTVAHSITLTLAALGVVAVPIRVVEAGIAASVILAALNNIYPLVQGNRWAVAFGFGLLHGFGFAAVLAGPDLPRGALVSSLLGFNLGVESGQLVIVLAFLPLAYALRRSWVYQRFSTGVGSELIALIGTVWLVERVLDIRLLPV